MKYFVMFLDHNGPVGVSALWGDGGRWVRFYGDESKDYPRPVFYDDRASALKHARCVIGWIKRNRDQLLFRRAYSYKVLPIRNAAEQMRAGDGAYCACKSSTEYEKDGVWLCGVCHLPRR